MEHSCVAPRQTAKNSIESADSSSLRSFAPAVPMMKAAEPSVRGVLIQGIVNPILVVVVHVIENEPPQMSFVQSDDMGRASRGGSFPPSALRSHLPRCLNTRALRLQTGCLQEGDHIGIEFRVVVQDGITIRSSLGKRLTQLFGQPTRRSDDE